MAEVARQERRREATKRQIMGVFRNNGNSSDMAALAIAELKQQYQQRIEVLKTELDTSKSKQQQVMAAGMVKLSKTIKNMPVREFNALYKCDLLKLVQAVRDEQEAGNKKRSRVPAETPSSSRQGRGSKLLETPSRASKRGERLFLV